MQTRFNLLVCIVALAILLSISSAGTSTVMPKNKVPLPLPIMTPQLPINIGGWEEVAAVAVLLVIAVAAVVYMLSGVISSSNAREWSKMQIFEALLSFLLIVIFGAISYLFLTPVSASAFNSLGLVPVYCCSPSVCTPQSATPNSNPNLPDVNTLYDLSSCDLGYFMNISTTYFSAFYSLGFYAAILIPGFDLQFQPLAFIGDNSFNVTFGTPSLLPTSFESMLETADSGLITLILLNQIQLIMISGSLLFLSFFMTLGLIARTFGFTRTFGGAMIAFGLGLGFVYPLLVSMTYGFVDVQIQQSAVANLQLVSPGTSIVLWQVSTVNVGTIAGGLYDAVSSVVLGSGLDCGTIPLSAGCQGLNSSMLQIGYLIVGLLIIPLLNFAILDAFIIDFSTAIGERMEFMSLLGSVI